MIISKRFYSFITVFLLGALAVNAQNKPIGYWDSYLPYNTSTAIATDGITIFNGCKQGFYTCQTSNNNIEAYSKVTGMSDMGVQCVAYDAATSTTVIVYTNSNIDLYKDNTFYNIPDLKIKAVSGNKAVYRVYTENGVAYLSTSLGVIVLDLATHNIEETYQFIINGGIASVKDFIGIADSFYAITSIGVYKANKNNPGLQDFSRWELVDNSYTLSYAATANGKLYFANSSTVYELIGGTIQAIYYSDSIIEHIDGAYKSLLITEYIPHAYSGAVMILGNNDQLIDSFYCFGVAVQAIQLADSSIWVADSYRGLQKRTTFTSLGTTYLPVPGPVDVNSHDIYAYKGDVWVAHGAYSDLYAPSGNFDGFSHLSNNVWVNYGRDTHYYPFDSSYDFVTIVKDEKNGVVYAGSEWCGLMVLHGDDSYEIIKQNSIFDNSRADPHWRQILGLALDKSDNLWISMMNPVNQHQLYVKTADSNWYAFSLPCMLNGGPTEIDDNGQIWFAGAGSGVGVYNTNNTISDPTDDSWYCLQAGAGFGNLPSNNVFCIAKDMNNNMWIGTSNGIGIASNCYAPFTGTPPCDAQIPIVQYDQYAGYLFAGNNVRTIAVDGANRKWVGTDNGVWLLSSDASQIVYRFTTDNSPLPSNRILKIAIDKVTGDVYIGTDQGLVSYRSTATEGGTTNSDVTIFPDPVPSGYAGTIAIRGLVANADVRITDISGQLVYRTKALGGQAVWNGVDYKGHRPQSGVYLVFASSSDGAQIYSGKMVFLQ